MLKQCARKWKENSECNPLATQCFLPSLVEFGLGLAVGRASSSTSGEYWIFQAIAVCLAKEKKTFQSRAPYRRGGSLSPCICPCPRVQTVWAGRGDSETPCRLILFRLPRKKTGKTGKKNIQRPAERGVHGCQSRRTTRYTYHARRAALITRPEVKLRI